MEKGTYNRTKINRKRILAKGNDRFSEYNRRFWERRNKRTAHVNNKTKGDKNNG